MWYLFGGPWNRLHTDDAISVLYNDAHGVIIVLI